MVVFILLSKNMYGRSVFSTEKTVHEDELQIFVVFFRFLIDFRHLKVSEVNKWEVKIKREASRFEL